jgi:ABC-2 type transport system permease protein
LTLLRQELFKLVRRGRTYFGFVTLLGVLIPVLFGFKYGSLERFLPGRWFSSWQLIGSPFNGLWIAWFGLDWLIRVVPVFVCLVGGEMIGGEAGAGTLRALLVRPVSRTRLFLAKSATTFLYVVVLMGFFGTVSLGVGVLVLGRGPLLLSEVLVERQRFEMLAEGSALLRLGLAYLLVIWGTWVVAALALLLSTLAENALAPAIGALAITIGCWTLETMPFPWQEQIKPFLFTTYFDVWRELFAVGAAEPIRWDVIQRGVWVSGLHLTAFLALGWFIFRRREVTS